MRMLVLFPQLFAKRYVWSTTIASTSSKFASTTHEAGKKWSLVAAMIVGVVLICATLINAQESSSARFAPVNIYVPAFDSPKGKPLVGRRTGLILALQLWRTYSTDTRAGSEFDNANIVYGSASAPINPQQLERMAQRQRKKPNLVLWGRASQYGEGIVVESNLWIRAAGHKIGSGSNIWSITILDRGKSHTVSVDLPRRHYEFAPIVLNPNVIHTPNADPTYVTIYELKSINSRPLGNLQENMVRATRHDGDWSEVMVDDIHRLGWVYLPRLSERPSEVVNFCGGIIRFLRNDWSGSIKLFENVLSNDNAPTAIKVDSYLYMAMAYDKLNNEAMSFSMVEEAYRLNPYSKTTTQYLFMIYLNQLSRVIRRDPHAAEARTIIRLLENIISKNAVLFAENDSWFVQAKNLTSDLTRSLAVRD